MDSVEKEAEAPDPDEEERQERIKRMPILEQCYNLMDFEAVARRVMKRTAWAYYSSGADDEIVSATESHLLFYSAANMSLSDYAGEPFSISQDLVSAAGAP